MGDHTQTADFGAGGLDSGPRSDMKNLQPSGKNLPENIPWLVTCQKKTKNTWLGLGK